MEGRSSLVGKGARERVELQSYPLDEWVVRKTVEVLLSQSSGVRVERLRVERPGVQRAHLEAIRALYDCL